MAELLDIFDADGNCIGVAPREECHGNPDLLHRTSHVVIFHPVEKAILLQLRKKDRRIQPGKWDTSVGGHLAHGENYLDGAVRELREELGVSVPPENLQFLFNAPIRNEIESEDTRVFALTHGGPFHFQKSEIDDVRFWRFDELQNPANHPLFTPNLVRELERMSPIMDLHHG